MCGRGDEALAGAIVAFFERLFEITFNSAGVIFVSSSVDTMRTKSVRKKTNLVRVFFIV